jgi:hypothetical protein
MPTHVRTEVKDGKRITTRFNHLPLSWLFARVAVANALPLIERGDAPATEEDIYPILERGATALVFLAMTVESAANQFGEDLFSSEFEDFEWGRGRFAKVKGMPEGVKKWHFIFQAKGKEAEFTTDVRPGLTTLFEKRHVLTHYKMTEHAEKWVAEEPFNPEFLVVFSISDKFVWKDPGITSAFRAPAVREFYETVRRLFSLWYDANGIDRAKVDELLPPAPLTPPSGVRYGSPRAR